MIESYTLVRALEQRKWQFISSSIWSKNNQFLTCSKNTYFHIILKKYWTYYFDKQSTSYEFMHNNRHCATFMSLHSYFVDRQRVIFLNDIFLLLLYVLDDHLLTLWPPLHLNKLPLNLLAGLRRIFSSVSLVRNWWPTVWKHPFFPISLHCVILNSVLPLSWHVWTKHKFQNIDEIIPATVFDFYVETRSGLPYSLPVYPGGEYNNGPSTWIFKHFLFSY